VDLTPASRPSRLQDAARWSLGLFLLVAGVGHFARVEDFLAQVPPFLPAPEAIVYVSGVVEIALGIALLALPRSRVLVGLAVAALFVAVFPGNISQAVTGAEGFGLGPDDDAARWGRLVFQPVLVAWALWCTGAGSVLRRWWRGRVTRAGTSGLSRGRAGDASGRAPRRTR
jgi:uncharacterized membrane protein